VPRPNWRRPLPRPVVIPKVMTLSTVGGILRGALYWVEVLIAGLTIESCSLAVGWRWDEHRPQFSFCIEVS
jgi:hypothetical protein